MALAAFLPLAAACSSVEKPTIRTVELARDIPPAAAAPDPKLSNPPAGQIWNEREIIDWWNEDRTGLKACIVQKHAALGALR